MEEIKITEKEEMMRDVDYVNHVEFPYKINMEILQYNIMQECYRDQRVSYFQLAPLANKTVPLEEADYILYAHPFARVEDFTEDVISDMEYMFEHRKPGAEIIVMGKATNVKDYIDESHDNITYVDKHYAEYVGKRFGLDIKDQYIVYDEQLEQLDIWPVDGCHNKCAFCRRCYMHIPFESQPFDFIKNTLDWYKENAPEKMHTVSLRAENLTEYGLDLKDGKTLADIIRLLNSYDEIKEIEIPIGMCIGEITDDILDALCECKKITSMSLNIEAGTDRLLKVIGKNHTCERAVYICSRINETHPDILLQSTMMVGLPTETLEDIIGLSEMIIKCKFGYVHCNYYGYSPKHPLAKYEQMNESLREYHLAYLIHLLKQNYNNDILLELYHEKIGDKYKRSAIREKEQIKERQKYHFAKILRITYTYFLGDGITCQKHDSKIRTVKELREKVLESSRSRRLSYLDSHRKR